jgi:menaquinone-dependent protoporphyrinogen oxidase
VAGTGSPKTGDRGLVKLCFLAATAWLFAGCAYASGTDSAENKGGNVTKGRILVAFETSKGSTAEIAQAIAEEFRSGGWDAQAVSIDNSPLSEEYDHVVLGGSIYMGSIKGVRGYVDKNLEKLRERLAGAFAVGMSFAADDKEKHTAGKKALENAITPLPLRHLGYFAGKLDTSKLSIIQKAIIKIVRSPVGDLRNWEKINQWTREIMDSLDS